VEFCASDLVSISKLEESISFSDFSAKAGLGAAFFATGFGETGGLAATFFAGAAFLG
jgi:hypothetical protein